MCSKEYEDLAKKCRTDTRDIRVIISKFYLKINAIRLILTILPVFSIILLIPRAVFRSTVTDLGGRDRGKDFLHVFVLGAIAMEPSMRMGAPNAMACADLLVDIEMVSPSLGIVVCVEWVWNRLVYNGEPRWCSEQERCMCVQDGLQLDLTLTDIDLRKLP